MDNERNDFLNIASKTGFKMVNHNTTDHETFRDFQAQQSERFKDYEASNALENRKTAVQLWDANTPSRWRGASLSDFNVDVKRKVLGSFKNNIHQGFFIYGDSGSGKTPLAHAIFRRLIGAGKKIPSEIKVLSEQTVKSFANTGFTGQNEFQDLLKMPYTGFILDGVSNSADYNSRELKVVESIISHAYEKSITLIITSVEFPGSWAKSLSETAEARLKSMVRDNFIKLSTENEIIEWPESDGEEKSHLSGWEK